MNVNPILSRDALSRQLWLKLVYYKGGLDSSISYWFSDGVLQGWGRVYITSLLSCTNVNSPLCERWRHTGVKNSWRIKITILKCWLRHI